MLKKRENEKNLNQVSLPLSQSNKFLPKVIYGLNTKKIINSNEETHLDQHWELAYERQRDLIY